MTTSTMPTPADLAAYLTQKYAEETGKATTQPTATADDPATAATPEPNAEPVKEAEPVEDKPRQKPWGDDNPFDEQRAWNLIENLRNENSRLKAERADQMKYVQPTDNERELRERLAQVEAQLLNAERSKALVEAGLPNDLISLVTASDPEGIKQQIQLLTSLRGQSVPDPAGELPAFTDPTLTNAPNAPKSLGARLHSYFG